MPFPASNGSIPLTLEAAWAGARTAAQQVQQQATALNSQLTGNVSSQLILNACTFFASLNTQLTQCASVGGLSAYAQAQVNNPSLDVAGAFTTMQNALVAVITWIATNFPKDGSNNLLYAQFNGSGQVVFTQFTSAQLAPLNTLLTALIATIN